MSNGGGRKSALVTHRSLQIARSVAGKWCVAVRLLNHVVLHVHLPSSGSHRIFENAVQEMTHVLREAGMVGRGISKPMCKHVLVVGDFNTRFQFEVPGMIQRHAIDHAIGFHAHKKMSSSSELG